MGHNTEIEATKICIVCKKEFTFKSKNPELKKFCSRSCQGKKWRENNKEYEHSRVTEYLKRPEVKKRNKLIREGKIIPKKRKIILRKEIEITKVCPICNKKFTKISKNPWQVKYCSKFCEGRLYREENSINEKKRIKEWQDKNKDKLNVIQRRYYKNNRQKQDCRTFTKKLLNREPYLLSTDCKMCGKKDKDNEIHHDIYPEKTDNIRIAIKRGQIYYLCRNCHTKYHKNENFNNIKKSS